MQLSKLLVGQVELEFHVPTPVHVLLPSPFGTHSLTKQAPSQHPPSWFQQMKTGEPVGTGWQLGPHDRFSIEKTQFGVELTPLGLNPVRMAAEMAAEQK